MAVVCAGGYAFWTRADKTALPHAPAALDLVVLIAVGLLFRVPPYRYVLGGQDEGVYVNMAAEIARSGSIVPRDRVLERMPPGAVTDRYLAENYGPGSYLPGVYRTATSPPKLVFQFYQLFPVWMATFEGVFGSTGAFYALTFLALFSLVFLYRLALTISASRTAAIVAALLVAVNPLHAFFSKFPVAEIPALAYSAAGFSFLALFWRAPSSERRKRWLVLSALPLFAMFLTRINGFMYLPFVILIGMAAASIDEAAIHRWALAVIALWVVSLLYGFKWSPYYSGDIYEASFQSLLGERWQTILAVSAGVCAAAWLAIARSRSRAQRLFSFAMCRARSALGPLFALALALAAIRIYQLGFTSHFNGDFWLDQQMHALGLRWRAAKFTSLAACIEYLGPALFFTLVVLSFRRWANAALTLLLAFVLAFFYYLAWLQWVVPYQPYFARYLVSEFVPAAIVAVTCGWAALDRGWLKTATAAVLLVTAVYGAALCAAQLGKNENDGAYESLAALAARIGSDDLLLIEPEHADGFLIGELKTPLVYEFGLAAAEVSGASLADGAYMAALQRAFRGIYLLSFDGTHPPQFEPAGVFPFRVLEFEHSEWPPIRLRRRTDTRLYLYRQAGPTGR